MLYEKIVNYKRIHKYVGYYPNVEVKKSVSTVFFLDFVR